MAGRSGQNLTLREEEEIGIYSEAGVARPAKYDDAVYDSNRLGGPGHRWKTQEEKRAGEEQARQEARVGQAREKAVAQVREAAQRRVNRELAGLAPEDEEEEAPPVEPPVTDVVAEPPVVLMGAGGDGEAVTTGTAPRTVKPMPAAVANALRQTKPPSTARAAAPASTPTPAVEVES